MKKVKIENMTTGRVIVKDPSTNFRMIWERKGMVRQIDEEILEQLMYRPGVEYLFRQGMLAIIGEERDKVMEDLGLKVEGEESDIIYLTEEKIKEVLELKMAQFRKEANKLSREQLFELTNYCIKHERTDFEKVEFLKGKTGIDILSAIRLNRQDKEKVEEKEE